jgi:hypothetical protein
MLQREFLDINEFCILFYVNVTNSLYSEPFLTNFMKLIWVLVCKIGGYILPTQTTGNLPNNILLNSLRAVLKMKHGLTNTTSPLRVNCMQGAHRNVVYKL